MGVNNRMKKEITVQKKGKTLTCWNEEDIEELKDYKDNQLLRITVVGNDKQRSLTQMGTYRACCRLVADNTEDVGWDTESKVSDQSLIGAGWVDYRIVTPDGNVIVKPKSISFKNMRAVEANNVLSKAFDVMATFLKVSQFELIEMAKESMG